MFKKEILIRIVSIALVVLIIYSLFSVGLNPATQRLSLSYGVDDQPGVVFTTFRDGIVKVFSKPESSANVKEKKIAKQDSLTILQNSQNRYYGFVLVKFSDRTQGWLKFLDINRNFYPKGRENEIAVLNFFNKFDTLTNIIITAAVSLLISFLLFRFYPKINYIFTKRSEKAITTPQEPWFFFNALIIGVMLGYIFFFYRGRSVEIIMNGGFLLPSMELETLFLFLSFWGFFISGIFLIIKSVKDYGQKVGIIRSSVYVLLMFVITISIFFFISAAIYLLILILFFLGGSSSKKMMQNSQQDEAKSKRCSVCGGILGSHAMKCPNSGYADRSMSGGEFINLTELEKKR
jgi:hypothetical protein